MNTIFNDFKSIEDNLIAQFESMASLLDSITNPRSLDVYISRTDVTFYDYVVYSSTHCVRIKSKDIDPKLDKGVKIKIFNRELEHYGFYRLKGEEKLFIYTKGLTAYFMSYILIHLGTRLCQLYIRVKEHKMCKGLHINIALEEDIPSLKRSFMNRFKILN